MSAFRVTWPTPWRASAAVAAMLMLAVGVTGASPPAASVEGAKLPLRPSSRDQAVAWLRANNAFGPKHRLVDMLAKALDQDVDGGKAFFISLGKRLVKSRKPTLLAGRNGAFQAFEIPPDLAGKWVSDTLIEFKTTAALDEVVEPAPVVVLDHLQFDNATRRDAGGQITGSVAYQKLDPCDGNLALRLTYMVGDVTRTSYHTLSRGLPEDKGTLSFSFPYLKGGAGLLPVFVEVCSFANSERRGRVVVQSTSAAGLLMLGRQD